MGLKVEGLPWEMFDLGFQQVKGKGLMKTHLLKVRNKHIIIAYQCAQMLSACGVDAVVCVGFVQGCGCMIITPDVSCGAAAKCRGAADEHAG
jgi:hypothetical protein